MSSQSSSSSPSFSAKRRAARWISLPFAAIALGAVVFEEWIWRASARAMSRLARLPAVARAEKSLSAAPVWVAALAFLAPGLALFPAKLLGLWLIAKGSAGLGVLVFALAKFVGAAALTRVYALTEPSLRSIGWINASLNFVFGLKDALSSHLLSSLWARRLGAAARRLRAHMSQAKASWASKRMSSALRREKRKIESSAGSSK